MGKEMVRVVDNSQARISAEEKRYLVCIEEDSGEKDWGIMIGRTAAYEYIKERIEYINLDESFVLVETLKLADRKSIYSFMKYAQDFFEDNFDIDDYIKGDFDENDFLRSSNGADQNEIMQQINQARNDGNISTQEFIDGGINSIPLD
jgi:hypothetical protein